MGGPGTSMPLLVDELVELELDDALDVELELDVLLEVAPLLVLVELPKLDDEVEVEAVKMALLLLPPKKAPLKNPKPRPLPPLDPTTATGGAPPELLAIAMGGGKGGMGGG
ncbi:MAG TPA: hypothetical protein VK472_08525 [Allosphingosinicella sp.]|nr:hypothetical protein [Allosphingosinicella sp.]